VIHLTHAWQIKGHSTVSKVCSKWANINESTDIYFFIVIQKMWMLLAHTPIYFPLKNQFFLPMIFCKLSFSLFAIHDETNIKSPQRSRIERQLFIKCLSFPYFGRHLLNVFYIMYIVKLVKHSSLSKVYTLFSSKHRNCYFYTPSTIHFWMWIFRTYIQSFHVVSILQEIFNLLSIW
jgi:hypothetical protein